MKPYKKLRWGAAFFLAIGLMAGCVTINIYFPAEKVESVAGEIVDDIRGLKQKQDNPTIPQEKNSLFFRIRVALSPSQAWAEEVTTVSNPTIRALKEKMRARFAMMKSYYQKGVFSEGDDGYVSIKNIGGLDLKTRRDAKNLASAENKDRKVLYAEVARALKIDPSQIDRIAKIFAKEWQESVR